MKNQASKSKRHIDPRVFYRPFIELFWGFKQNTLPTLFLAVWVALACLFLFTNADLWLLGKLELMVLYPSHDAIRGIYGFALLGSGHLFWGLHRTGVFLRFERKLKAALGSAGLQNRLGQYPKLIFDKPLDAHTRKLRLTRAHLPVKDFETKKPHLEASLKIYIDSIIERRENGTVDILYANKPMPKVQKFPPLECFEKCQFQVGQTRSRSIICSLKQTPHLLIAGQTGGGKSTALRQIITTLYLRNQGMEFLLVDLKAGLEFQIFEDLPRVTVPLSVDQVGKKLELAGETLTKRMELLKGEKVKDIDAYNKKLSGKKAKLLNRVVIVVDEAAELFLAGDHASASEIQKIRRTLSRIARQGRACGLHLIVATQRPDAKALDPQVKANLTGIISFPMANLPSSMTILGCGRAAELPPISGRAIYKNGLDMVELQTPFLSVSDAESLLESSRQQGKAKALQPQKNAAIKLHEAAAEVDFGE